MEVAHLIGVVAVIGLVLFSAFFQLSIILWTITIGAGLLALTYFGFLSAIAILFFWAIYLLAALVANLHPLRQRYLVEPAINHLKKQMPPISDTERIAIEAGNTWWEKELFCGRPEWQKLFDLPKPTLTEDEQHFIDNQVEHLCKLIDDWKIVEEADIPPKVWNYLKKEKFFGIVIPKQYKGLGFSALAHSTIIQKIATRSMSVAVSTMVPNSLGPGELLAHYGTEDQKNYYLPRLATGEEIPCFALTAPEAGSDASSIPDTGIICRGMYDGKKVVGIRLNWDKRYITLAPIATVLGLAVHLYDPDHLLGENEDIGITLCLIPTSHHGVETGTRHYPLQLAFMNGPTRGKDVFIPLEWIIGGPERIGQGWKMVMEGLAVGRSISLPALSTACGKLTYRYTGAYAQLRRQFRVPLAAFEGIQESLGYIAGYTYTLEACRIMTAGAVDLNIRPAIASAIAKYHTTEISRQVIAHAMDIHAGQMIQLGPRNFLGHVHFAIPISITVEGANILTRNLIIFGQGAIRCHPYILKEIELISAPVTPVKELDQVLVGHVGYSLSTSIRNLAFGLTGGKFIFSDIKNKRIRKLHQQLTRMSAALALVSDVSLIVLGGSLKRRERISARLGDIMSQLYLASSVLKYYYDQGKPLTDVDYVCWSLQECLYKIQLAINELFNNFPKRWIGKLLNLVIFPFGQPYKKPKDSLHAAITAPMFSHSDFRNRLTQYCYQSDDKEDACNRLDQGLKQAIEVEPLLRKLHKSLPNASIDDAQDTAALIRAAKHAEIITPDEAKALLHFEALRAEVIKVNEFSFNLDKVIV